MAIVTLAATQMACSWDLDDNIQKAEEQVTHGTSHSHGRCTTG